MQQPLGISLRATCEAVRALIAAIHEGRLEGYPVPQCVRPDKLRWTPSFIEGKGPALLDSRPYTVSHLSLLLGNATESPSGVRPHDIVRLAVLLLELQELGEITEDDLEKLFTGEIDLSMKSLGNVLRGTREDHYQIEAQQILSAV